MEIRTIFFDAVGTLIHLAEPVGVVYARFAAGHGLEVAPDKIEGAFRSAWKSLPPPLHPEGQPAPDDDRSWWLALVTATFAQALDAPAERGRMKDLFGSLYDHFSKAEAWCLYPDVRPALAMLGREFSLHLLSNFDQRLESILRGHGLWDCFETCTVSSQVGASKPHPRIFAHALRGAGAEAKQALHVGDETEADVCGALSVGLAAFQVQRPLRGLDMLAEYLSARDFSCLQKA